MKSFFKQNLLYILLSTLCVSIFIVLIYLSFKLSTSTEILIDDAQNLNDDLYDITQQISYFDHVESDIIQVNEDLSYLANTEKELLLFLNYIFNEPENVFDKWSSKSAESVNASLTRLLPRLRKKCSESNIILPSSDIADSSAGLFQNNTPKSEESNFGFSFKSYDGFWPSFSTQEARKLGVQTEIVKELVDYLSLSTDDNHSVAILSLQRESVGEIDKSNIGGDVINISDIRNDLLRDVNEIESYVFKLSIQTQTVPLRKLFNKLRPPFLIREFNIKPVEEQNVNEFQTAQTTPDPFSLEPSAEEKFLPIVSKVDSKVDLIIEYVISSNRTLDSLFDKLSRRDETQPEILLGWLESAGHNSLLEKAKDIFNEKNTR